MKTIKTVLFILAALVAYTYFEGKKSLTQDEFRNYREEFRAEIDSLKMELDTVKIELRMVKTNTDTLKAGQEVIYRQVKPKSNEFLKDLIMILKQ